LPGKNSGPLVSSGVSIYNFETGEPFVTPVIPRLRYTLLAALISLAPPPGAARNRTSDKLRGEARAAEVEGKFDEAFRLAKQALALDPSDPAYALEVHRIRFEDGAMHIRTGYKLRAASQLEQALAEFLNANETDPASDLADRRYGSQEQ
jgi:tetratricopeptide (TPR) repeat protein